MTQPFRASRMLRGTPRVGPPEMENGGQPRPGMTLSDAAKARRTEATQAVDRLAQCALGKRQCYGVWGGGGAKDNGKTAAGIRCTLHRRHLTDVGRNEMNEKSPKVKERPMGGSRRLIEEAARSKPPRWGMGANDAWQRGRHADRPRMASDGDES